MSLKTKSKGISREILTKDDFAYGPLTATDCTGVTYRASKVMTEVRFAFTEDLVITNATGMVTIAHIPADLAPSAWDLRGTILETKSHTAVNVFPQADGEINYIVSGNATVRFYGTITFVHK